MLHQTIKSLFLKIFNVLRAKAQRSSTVCVLLKMTRFNELYCRKFEPMRSLEHKTRTNEITPFGTLMPIFGNVPHKGTYHSILLGNLVLLLNRWRVNGLTTDATCQQVVPTTLLQFVVVKLGTSCCDNLPQIFNSTTCQQVVDNNLVQVDALTTCQQVVPTFLLQFVVTMVVTKLVTTCSNNLLQVCKSTTCQQVVENNLLQVDALTTCQQVVQTPCYNLLSPSLIQVVPTTCYKSASPQPVNKLLTTTCDKLLA